MESSNLHWTLPPAHNLPPAVLDCWTAGLKGTACREEGLIRAEAEDLQSAQGQRSRLDFA
jgi:hypothetical protein